MSTTTHASEVYEEPHHPSTSPSSNSIQVATASLGSKTTSRRLLCTNIVAHSLVDVREKGQQQRRPERGMVVKDAGLLSKKGCVKCLESLLSVLRRCTKRGPLAARPYTTTYSLLTFVMPHWVFRPCVRFGWFRGPARLLSITTTASAHWTRHNLPVPLAKTLLVHSPKGVWASMLAYSLRGCLLEGVYQRVFIQGCSLAFLFEFLSQSCHSSRFLHAWLTLCAIPLHG